MFKNGTFQQSNIKPVSSGFKQGVAFKKVVYQLASISNMSTQRCHRGRKTNAFSQLVPVLFFLMKLCKCILTYLKSSFLQWLFSLSCWFCRNGSFKMTCLQDKVELNQNEVS